MQILIIELKTDKKIRMIIPLTCLAAAVISGAAGIISYTNDHSFVLRGMEAEMIWFLISLPAFVAAIVHFIAGYIQLKKQARQ